MVGLLSGNQGQYSVADILVSLIMGLCDTPVKFISIQVVGKKQPSFKNLSDGNTEHISFCKRFLTKNGKMQHI